MSSSDSFGARSTLEVGGRAYEVFRLDALQERFDVARLPYSIKVLLENVLRLEDGVSVTRRRRRGDRRLGRRGRAQRRDPLPAGAGADAGLHRRAGGGRPGGDARRDGRDRRRPGGDQPAGRRRPGDRPLGPGRRLRQRRAPSPSTPSASSSATASATRSSSGASRPSTTSASCRRRPGSATRSTSSTSPRSSTAARATAALARLSRHPGRHRLAHDDGQRARRARLGGRRDRGRGGDARPADLDAAAAGGRLQARRRAAARARPRPTWS